jgi:hypothetical protein
MAIYVTQIEKHRFVCGLFWQSLSRPRELIKEAQELARKIDFDLMVLRADQTTAQAGFAQSREGVKPGLYSLAAAVSKTLAVEGAFYDGHQQRVHNWLGAFKLPDGMWAYFAVRDASFLPNGDFAGTKEEVLERLHGDYGLGGWNAVIGDAELEDYGFHNFNARRIQDLLPHTSSGQIRPQKWWGLRPVRRKIPMLPIAAGFAAVTLAAAGGFAYWTKVQRERALLEQERALAEARAKAASTGVAAVIPHPWASAPAPSVMAQACEMQLTHVTPGGWQLQDFVCTRDSATYTWTRENSTIAFLREQVPEAAVDLGGNKATYSSRLQLPAGKDDVLLERGKLLDPILTRLQLLSIVPRIAEAPAVPAAPASSDGAALPAPGWKVLTIALDAPGLRPTDIAAALANPGVRIEKIAYRNGVWSIEGVMYAK